MLELFPQSHYNTTDLEGDDLQQREAQAKTQEEIILDHFVKNRDNLLTPEQLIGVVPHGTPITSIRRAFTNLKKASKIVKTDIKKPGMYGMVVHCWRLETTNAHAL